MTTLRSKTTDWVRQKMRILAWNTTWNISEETVEKQTAAVAALGVDVAFFSEWSPSPTRDIGGGKKRRSAGHIRGGTLATVGLKHQCQEHVSDRLPDGQAWSKLYWGVLAASRTPISKVEIDPPLYAPGTWLEIRHEHTNLTIVGVRVPAWSSRDLQPLRRSYWQWMLEQFDRLQRTPAIVLGDFNTETTHRPGSAQQKRQGADLLLSLTTERGWRDAVKESAGRSVPTYIRNNGRASRVDYAFISPGFTDRVQEATSPDSVDEQILLRSPGSRKTDKASGLSDHAPVMVDIEMGQAD